MRKIERVRIDDKLDADKREWKKTEDAEEARLKVEQAEAEARRAADEGGQPE